jgi:hypothetical protein
LGAYGATAISIEELVYELLDAHEDTLRLASDLPREGDWGAHCEYLRDLQRIGRERLARMTPSESLPAPPSGA